MKFPETYHGGGKNVEEHSIAERFMILAKWTSWFSLHPFMVFSVTYSTICEGPKVDA